jgi:hypothetical protein
VIRINAPAVVARVKKDHTIGDRAIMDSPR